VSLFGEFSVISGRVESVEYSKGSMDVQIGGQKLSMPLTSGTLINSFDAGSDMEFAVRRNLLMRRQFTARAFKDRKDGKIHTSRTFHYWFGLVVAAAMVGFWRHVWPLKPEQWWMIPAIVLFAAYSLVALLETREAVRLLERS
jgi:hypothetical protein